MSRWKPRSANMNPVPSYLFSDWTNRIKAWGGKNLVIMYSAPPRDMTKVSVVSRASTMQQAML